MIEQLQPFIVTAWHGHRNDPDIPAAVRRVWQEKFNPRRGPPTRAHSNVDLAVLDSRGQVVHWFDGFAHENFERRNSLAQYTARELRHAMVRLDRHDPPQRRNPLTLPDLKQSRGIRLFVRLMDERMTAYQAPVVELVALEPDDWKPLAWPDERHTVNAGQLTKWLSQIYPPGVMERTNPQTKQAYKIKSVTGTLALVPAGSDATRRFARLSGKITLTDDGGDDFSYEGQLDAVLTYELGDRSVQSLRGVFDGDYPRFDRMQDRTRWIPLEAVFESRPK